MTNKKLTDNEIIKALECCISDKPCIETKCPLHNDDMCGTDFQILEKLALDLINRLQEENERLEKENKLLIDYNPANRYSNCVLVKNGEVYTKTLEDYDKLLADISAEAYKEFADKLNAEAEKVEIDREGDFVETVNKIYNTVADWCKATSDNLLKELVGGSDEE